MYDKRNKLLFIEKNLHADYNLFLLQADGGYNKTSVCHDEGQVKTCISLSSSSMHMQGGYTELLMEQIMNSQELLSWVCDTFFK